MSQSATLYRIAQIDFSKILDNPEDFDIFKINKGYTTFEQSHEGLRFVLSKNANNETKVLADSIFYPKILQEIL